MLFCLQIGIPRPILRVTIMLRKTLHKYCCCASRALDVMHRFLSPYKLGPSCLTSANNTLYSRILFTLIFFLLHWAAASAASWSPAPPYRQIPIWPQAIPNAKPPLQTETVTPQASHGGWQQVSNVSLPSMTIYPAQGINTGAAVIVFPGGGFKVLAIDLEGTEICDWLTARGITCVLLKYRVPGGNHYWDEHCACHITPTVPRALQDAQRTIKLIRARAAEWGIDPAKIGVIGFSAGGYLVAQTSTIFKPTYHPIDATDVISSRPDFAIALYPGHLCRAGRTLDPSLKVTRQAPPTFLLQAWDDPVDPVCNSMLYAQALDRAGVPVEVHLFAQGGHAFGLRSRDQPIGSWPVLVESWLKQIGIVK